MVKKHRRTLLLFDRILAHRTREQILILLAVLVGAFLTAHIILWIAEMAGLAEEWNTFCEKNKISRFAAPFYLLIDGNAFNTLYLGEKAVLGRWLTFVACLIYIAGSIIFTGMIISVMTNMIERRVEDYRNGTISYLLSGHYVIMGFDKSVPSVISHIFEKDKKAYVCLLTSKKVIEAKELLLRVLGEKKMKRVIINYGHRTSSEGYERIKLHAAEEIFVVGYHKEPAHDAINIECVDSIYQYFKSWQFQQFPKRITCVFRDLDTYAAFKTSEIFKKIGEINIEFVPFNYYSGWAQQVFVNQCYRDCENPERRHSYPSIYGKGITPDDKKFVHLVFVGTTNFAVAFAMEAAHLLHFPNFDRDNALKTRITFIDVNADREKDEFITRNRHFFAVQSYRYWNLSGQEPTAPIRIYENNPPGNRDFLDVEFEFIKGDIFSRRVQQEICRLAKDRDGQYLSIFLAMKDQRENFVMGMNMPEEVYDNAIPVFIYQERSDNFVTNLRLADTMEGWLPYSYIKDGELKIEERPHRYANIYPFGMNESVFCADDTSLCQAKLINYLYATCDYSQYKFKGTLALSALPEEQLWNEANEEWRKLNVSLKWSNLYSAYSIKTKVATLRAMRGLDPNDASQDFWPLSDDEAEILARVEHNRWNVEKLLMGYRKARPEEDKYEHTEHKDKLPQNKKHFIHHDIRPFDDLDDVKKLDYEFSRYIPWILKRTAEETELS